MRIKQLELSFTLIALFFILYSIFFIHPVLAIFDPLSQPNNRFGIHIISPTTDEIDSASQLVNSSGGDWGYITVVIQDKDQDLSKWQQFFDHLRERHLIPLVRIATHPSGNFWVKPEGNAPENWANFLNKLNWPIKNRYVIVYNEPNHATEWGGSVDAKEYAQILNKTIDALKAKNPDFFILNAGLDASAPQKLPAYQEEISFLQQMNQEVPNLFEKIDGWNSHSYPNPGFIGIPTDQGRGTVRTWAWETQQLKRLGVKKDLPIFITETGWKHAEGIDTDNTLPTAQEVSKYYKQAFETVWSDKKIVAITPFLLTYPQPPFDHFSFKRAIPSNNPNVLGAEFYPQYQILNQLPKESGSPIQENKAELVKGGIYHNLVEEQTYSIPLTFKNTGQSIWNEYGQVKLFATGGSQNLDITISELPKDIKIKPGQEQTFILTLKAPSSGDYQVLVNLFKDETIFDSPINKFNTTVQSPIKLQIKADLAWKKDHAGEYLLTILSNLGKTAVKVLLNQTGESPVIKQENLLPEYEYTLTFQRPFYQPKTIHQKLHTGVNTLDFGTLQPNIQSAIIRPNDLWRLLPFSN